MTVPLLPRPAWLDSFTVPDRFPGAVLALDAGPDGVWAARLTPDLSIAAEVTEPRITPAVLDVRTAMLLRDTGAVPQAAEPDVFAELLTICARARATLAERDSALLMGDERLRLVTVTLAELMTATLPEVNRVHGMIVELAGRDPVDAILLGPGTDAWPGLWEALTDRGFSPLLPGDRFPETFAGDDGRTAAFDAVDSGAVAIAAGSGTADPVAADSGAVTALAWTAVPADDGPADDDPAGPAPGPAPRSAAEVRRGRAVLAAAAVGVVAVTGAAVAVATMSGDDAPAPPAAAPVDDDAVRATPTEAATPTTAEPADIKAARATMKRYRPPAPPPTTVTTSEPKVSEVPTGPQPTPTPRPKDTRRTIPNPIPGLPPIIIG